LIAHAINAAGIPQRQIFVARVIGRRPSSCAEMDRTLRTPATSQDRQAKTDKPKQAVKTDKSPPAPTGAPLPPAIGSHPPSGATRHREPPAIRSHPPSGLPSDSAQILSPFVRLDRRTAFAGVATFAVNCTHASLCSHQNDVQNPGTARRLSRGRRSNLLSVICRLFTAGCTYDAIPRSCCSARYQSSSCWPCLCPRSFQKRCASRATSS
jgi:hypothetical protein